MKLKKGLALAALCTAVLCSCGGEKEETTSSAPSARFETTAPTAEASDSETSEFSGGMTVHDEFIIGADTDGVIDFSE